MIPMPIVSRVIAIIEKTTIYSQFLIILGDHPLFVTIYWILPLIHELFMYYFWIISEIIMNYVIIL